MSGARDEAAPTTFRGWGVLVALCGSVAICVVGAPLVPGLTPDWPRSGSLAAFLVSAGFLVIALLLVKVRGPEALTPGVLVFAGLLPLYSVYTGNGRVLTSGDNLATRALPSHLIRTRTLDLSKVPPFDGPDLPYSVTRVGDRVLNSYPSGTAFVAVPYALLGLAGSGGAVDGGLISRWDKHSSALLTMTAVGFFFAATRRFGRAAALGATAVFALATPLPTAPAQSLWSFTGEVLCLCVALYGLLGLRSRPWLAGAAMGAAFACRPTALASAFVLLAVTALGERKTALRFGASTILAVGGVAIWQFRVYGHPLGAYGVAQSAKMGWQLSGEALLGVLVSPSRGLISFFPYVLLVPVAAVLLFRRGDREMSRWWCGSVVLVAAAVFLAASHSDWWGGWGLGPRLMTECAPFLALATVPLWTAGRRARLALVAAFAFSASTQLMLAYSPAASEWNERLHLRARSRSLVGIRESQVLAAWIPGWLDRQFGFGEPRSLAGPDSPELSGSTGAPERRGDVAESLGVQGWARRPGEDLDVFFFIDGIIVRPTVLRRTSRPDVAAAFPLLGDCATAGFEAVIPFQGEGGPHDFRAVARSADGRIRRLEERRFEWSR